MQPKQHDQHYSTEPQHTMRCQQPERMSGNPDVHKHWKSFWHHLFRRDRRQHRRIRIFTWWNLFAVIGIVTVIVQLIRYVIVPALVYLNVLTGGAL